MNYIEVHFTVEPKQPGTDILIARLSDMDFDSFVETENGVQAYIPERLFDEPRLKESDISAIPGFSISYNISTIPSQNWNHVWESNFEPVIVNNDCAIRAPFHSLDKKYPFEIIIEPKMSFGTGHHETTSLMMNLMMEEANDCIKGKDVLDMGCGTAVLSILAKKLQALKVTAIDNDSWAFENSKENIQINFTPEIEVLLGDASLLSGKSFDTIIANINRNILLRDMQHYSSSIKNGGSLFISGFFNTDLSALTECANKLNLKFVKQSEKNNWAVVQYIKQL
jgi:ribosomal protein L11 methyltransferase